MATIIHPAQCAQIAKYWKKLLIWTQSDQMLESETKMFPAIRHDFNPIMLVLRFWPKNQTYPQNIAQCCAHLLCEYRAERTYRCWDKSILRKNPGRRPAEPPATPKPSKKKKRLAGVQNGHKVTTTGCCQPFVSHEYDLRSHPANSLFSFSSNIIQELTSTAEGR